MRYILSIERDTSPPCHFASVAELEDWNRSQQQRFITAREDMASGSWTKHIGLLPAVSATNLSMRTAERLRRLGLLSESGGKP